MLMVNNKISLSLILTLLLGSTLTYANDTSSVRVNGPDGFKIYSFRTHNLDECEIVKLYHKGLAKGVGPANSMHKSEAELDSMLYNTGTELIYKYIAMGADILNRRGHFLDFDQVYQVEYSIKSHRNPNKLIDWPEELGYVEESSWDYDLKWLTNSIEQFLKLSPNFVGEQKINPRYFPKRLVRDSYYLVNLNFVLRNEGVVTLPILFGLEETYFPFVAEIPHPSGTGFGELLYGSPQVLYITTYIPHLKDKAAREKIDQYFGYWIQTTLFFDLHYGIRTQEVQALSDLPNFLTSIAYKPTAERPLSNIEMSGALDYLKLSQRKIMFKGSSGNK